MEYAKTHPRFNIYGIKDHSKGLREDCRGLKGLDIRIRKDRVEYIDQWSKHNGNMNANFRGQSQGCLHLRTGYLPCTCLPTSPYPNPTLKDLEATLWRTGGVMTKWLYLNQNWFGDRRDLWVTEVHVELAKLSFLSLGKIGSPHSDLFQLFFKIFYDLIWHT